MKRILSIFLIVTMILSLSACASKQSEEPSDPDTPPVNEQNDDADDKVDIDSEVNEVDEKNNEEKDENIKNSKNNETNEVSEKEKENEKEVELYFANAEYIQTGDESFEKLIAEKRTIKYTDTNLEEIVVREVLKGPVDNENLVSPINDTLNLLEVKVKNDTAYVDFSSKGLTGGSMQEIFTINQIVKSLISLDTVKNVQFLVDGENTNSLMGHVAIDEPFQDIVD